MIPFKSFLGFKKVDKEAWLNKKISELETEFSEEISNLEKSCVEIKEEKEEELKMMEDTYQTTCQYNERHDKKDKQHIANEHRQLIARNCKEILGNVGMNTHANDSEKQPIDHKKH